MIARNQYNTTSKCEKTDTDNKSPVGHTEARDDCVEADIETVLPENAETISDGGLTDDSSPDETTNSSKVEDLASDNMGASLMISSDVVVSANTTANTCHVTVVEDTSRSKCDDVDSWNLEAVLSRAPWKMHLRSQKA
jgi:hypothetical protein